MTTNTFDRSIHGVPGRVETNPITQTITSAAEGRYLFEQSHKILDDSEELAEIQPGVDVIEGHQTVISSKIDAHRALSSPALRLPPELLSEIFLECLPEGIPYLKCSGYWRSKHEAPVKLGRICRAWRQTALSTPQLWSHFHLIGYGD